MHISDSNFIMGSGIGNNIRTTQKNNESISDKNVNLKSNRTANSDIVQLSEGQKFDGEITGITGDKVDILLNNNKNLSARMSEAVNLNIGDKLTFEVKENSGANVVISPMMESLEGMKDSAIFSILEGNGFSPTEKNYNIAESLLKNNMSVDKASMQKLMQQSYKFPDTSIDTLIQLGKMKLPINETTINQYNDYMNNTHQLVNDIANLSESLSNIQGELTNELFNLQGTAEAIININEQLLQMMSDESDMPQLLIEDEQLLTTNEGLEASMQEELSETGKELVGSENVTNAETQRLSEKDLGIEEPSIKDEALKIEDSSVISEEELYANNEKVMSELDSLEKENNKFGITEDGLSDLTDKLKALGLNENQIDQMLNHSDSAMKLLNTISKELKGMEGLSAEQLKDFFDSKEYKELFERGIKEKFTLDPNKMKEPKEVDELYKGMYEKANKLMSAFEGSGSSAGGQLQEQAKNVAERIDFINNLNNMFTYAQIPVRMNSQELNSELFVYMNKKNLRENKDNVSALLHLDMEHLGPTDVHVSLHGGIVHTKFYVEDEQSAKIIDQHMSMLEKAINDSGFKHTNEVIMREPTLDTKPNAVVNNMFDTDIEKSVKRYTFDMRT